jgi:hypothetical protein
VVLWYPKNPLGLLLPCPSARYLQENGLLQESVLIVIALGIAINGIVNGVGPSFSTSLYVGSIAIFYSSWSIDTVECWLQVALTYLSHGAVEDRFSFSAAKTQCVLYMITGFTSLLLSALTVALYCFFRLSSFLIFFSRANSHWNLT